MKPTENPAGQFEAASFSREREPIKRLERVAVAYPSGNTTAIVFDKLVPGCDPKVLNRQIMQTWKALCPGRPEVEQCCVVTQPQDTSAIARIEMLGGEFCGNATRSALWLLTGGQRRTGLIEVSGADRPLAFSVRDKEVMLEMPLLRDGTLVRRIHEGLLVKLKGIAQLVTPLLPTQTPRPLLENLLKINQYGLAEQPAVGVSAYDESSNQAVFCVWVKNVDTIFDETACGSGTCAIGIARSWEAGQSTALEIIQPSGEAIRTEAIYGPGTVTASFITGGVEVLYDGALELT